MKSFSRSLVPLSLFGLAFLFFSGCASRPVAIKAIDDWKESIAQAHEALENLSTPGADTEIEMVQEKFDEGLQESRRENHAAAVAAFYEVARESYNEAAASDGPWRDLHNIALGELIWEIQQADPQVFEGEDGVTQIGDRRYQFVSLDSFCSSPNYFDGLKPSHRFRQKGLKERYTREGLGAPLVAHRENRGEYTAEQYKPPEGIFYPVTATLGEEKGDAVTIELHNLKQAEVFDWDGQALPLAADYTMPWAALLSRSGTLKNYAISAMLRPDSAPRQARLYMMQPYDPNKIPIIMIHGLKSSPLAWVEVTNEIIGDPEIRRRYQVWHYLYPTGGPILSNGRIYRENIEELRRQLDPELDDFATNHMVVLAHSMGGLLTRTLITNTGSTIWDQYFRVQPEELNASAKQKENIREVFFFERKPYIKRVIFAAVPHRGSNFADNPLGRLGAYLIKSPKDVAESQQRLLENNPGAVRNYEFYQKLADRGGPTSVDTLSPRNKVLELLTDVLGIDPDVPHHSIIGDRGKDGPLEDSSDGIVPYWSSHLDSAESEIVVPTGHGAFKHPDAMKEIKRILKMHAGATNLAAR